MATLSQAIQHIPAEEYHSRVALSNSGMKDLAVSPLRFWYTQINPDRPPHKQTPEMEFGTALHCLVLEGESVFNQRYVRGVDQSEYPGCLVTIEELRDWLRDHGKKPSGTRKADVIRQVREVDPRVPIWDLIADEHEAKTAGKRVGCKEEFDRLFGAAEALSSEPAIKDILRNGEAEVSLFAEEPRTSVPLKARLDWLANDCILDLKTFVQKRGKSIDQSVADAMYYEGYFRQAYFYATLHQQIAGRSKPLPVVMAFVESTQPHEIRIKELRPKYDGSANFYWMTAQIEVSGFCALWAKYMKEFGSRPWRTEQAVEPLLDGEMKGLAFA